MTHSPDSIAAPGSEKAKRVQPTLSERLAACLIIMGFMDRDHAKNLTAEQIISVVEADHFPVPFAIARDLGWTPKQYNHPTNIQFLGRLDHREKSKGDKTTISKTDRISAAHQAFRSKILAKAEVIHDRDEEGQPICKSQWPSRKMQSRPFLKKSDRSST